MKTGTPIVLDIEGRHIRGHLNTSATAQSLLAQLPLTLTFKDHARQEKIAPLPAALDLNDAPTRSGARATAIGYYAPDSALVLYYSDVAPSNGIVPIGSYEENGLLRNRIGTFTATLRITH